MSALVVAVDFNGRKIRRDGDWLHATDMWRAAGEDRSRRPAKWLQQKGTAEYIDALPGVPEEYTRRIPGDPGAGDGGGMWFHRLVAVEYARYLNPAFAVFVNRLFLDVTEDGGRMLARSGGVDAMLVHALERTAETLDRIERRMEVSETALAPLVKLPERIDRVEQTVADLRDQMSVAFAHKRKTPSKKTRETHIEAAQALGGICPFCDVPIFSDGDFVGQIHHHDKASDARVEATMPCCAACNQRFNVEPAPRFVIDNYHARRLRHGGPLFRRAG